MTAVDRRAQREEFRTFADTELAPLAPQHDLQERIDRALVARLAQPGYLAATLPAAYGGRELDMVGLGQLHEEIGRVCSATRSLLTAHEMVASTVLRWGTAAQRDRWLPAFASGQAVAAFALTEALAGSDAASLTTQAVPTGDGFVLDGAKRWISFGQLADVFLVFARTERGVSAFLADGRTTGITVKPVRDMLGSRGSMLADVTFERCALPAGSLIGGLGRAHPVVTTSALTVGRLSVAAGGVGIIQGCLDVSAAYAARRGLIGHQLVQRLIARMVVHAEAARLMSAQAAELIGAADPDAPMAAARAKYLAAMAAGDSARDAVQILGASGCSSQYPVARYFRDAKIMEIIEGSNEVIETMLGRFGHAPANSYNMPPVS